MKLLSAAAIRRCLIADKGHLWISADFDQIELRVAAALAGENVLIDAAKRGESLHKTAAVRLFGPEHTDDQYRYTKNVNFGWLFGGGPYTLSQQAGITMAQATEIIRDYESTFTALTAYKRRKQNEILKSALNRTEYAAYMELKRRMYAYRYDTKEGKQAREGVKLQIKRLLYRKVGWVITPFGRRLPVDAEKAYTVVNYIVQSCAADLMKQAFLDVMADEELEPTVLLIVHDELLGQAPRKEAQHYADRYAEVMTRNFDGGAAVVPISASGKVLGRSWGSGYEKKAA